MSRSTAPLLTRIQDRDVEVVAGVLDHGFLTAPQIGAIWWPGCAAQVVRRRLGVLSTDLNLLRAFAPTRAVKLHGAKLYSATSRGAVLVGQAVRSGAADPTVSPAHLRHQLAAADFRAALSLACHQGQGWSLTEWHAERACRARWGKGTLAIGTGALSTGKGVPGIVPDGYGVLEGPDVDLAVSVEVDQGRESRSQLRDKLRRLKDFAPADVGAILFLCADEDRVAPLLRSGRDTRVFTAGLATALADPLGAIWLPAEASDRVRLADVAPAL